MSPTTYNQPHQSTGKGTIPTAGILLLSNRQQAQAVEFMGNWWISGASETQITVVIYRYCGSYFGDSEMIADETPVEAIPNLSIGSIGSMFAVNFSRLVDAFKTNQRDETCRIVIADPPRIEDAVKFRFLGASVEWRPRAGRFYWTSESLPTQRLGARLEHPYQHELNQIYDADVARNPRRAMDYVVDLIDDLLNKSEFDECQIILAVADTRRLSDAVLISFLGITHGAKRKLEPERKRFYERALKCVADRRGVAGARRLLEKYL